MKQNVRDLLWICVMSVSLTVVFIGAAAIGGAR